MNDRSGRSLASGPLLAVLVAVFVTADFILIIDGRMSITRIHTLIVGFLVVAAIKLLLDHARKAAVAEIAADIMAAAELVDARRCCCTEATEPLRIVGTAAVRGTATVHDAIQAEPLPPDNVLAFEMGRRVEREHRQN